MKRQIDELTFYFFKYLFVVLAAFISSRLCVLLLRPMHGTIIFLLCLVIIY